mgnify:CR=1 FL=1
MLAKHSAFYFLACGLPGVINLLGLAIYTRMLSPEAFGAYALVIAGTGLGNAVLFQWLQLGVLRFLPGCRDRKGAFLGTILAVFFCLVVVTCLGGVVALMFLSDTGMKQLVAVGLVLLWVQAFFELNKELLRSEFSPRRYGMMAMTKSVVALTLGVVFVALGLEAIGLLFGLVIALGLSMVGQFKREWRQVQLVEADRQLFRQLAAYGLPLTATFALGFVISSSDRFFLGWLINAEATGLYAVGYDLANQTLGMVMMIINLAAYPLAVSALEREGQAAAERQLSQNAIALLGLGLPSAAGIILLAPEISPLFLGQAYQDSAAELMPWIAAAALLAGLKAYYFDLSFQLGKKTVLQVWVVLASALVNVGVNFFLIPIYGIMGSAYATVAAYAVGLILSWVLGRKVFPLPLPLREFGKIAIATGIMILPLLAFQALSGPWWLGLKITTAVLVFGGVSLGINLGGGRDWLLQRRQQGA